MTRVCFVGNEFYPVTAGGAGMLVYNLARKLIEEGHEVILCLDVSKASFEQLERDGPHIFGDRKSWRAYQVDQICAGIQQTTLKREDFLSRYTWESYRYDLAMREIYAREKPQLVEFVDYCGAAYFALNAKISGLSYQEAHLVIRIHGPLELIDRCAPSKPLDFDRYTAYALERAAFRLADSVLAPIQGLIEQYYNTIQSTWFGQKVVAPPPVTDFPRRRGEEASANLVLFYGRLFAVKGVDRFVNAALDILTRQPATSLQFVLVGYDSMEPPVGGPRSYQEYLWEKIPIHLRDRFIFTGQLDHRAVAELLPRVRMAVFPAYFESFGYAAQEMKLAGLPLILSDIPAFRAAFEDQVNGLFFDGSVADLVRKIVRLDEDETLRQRLCQAQPVTQAGSMAFYRNPPRSGWICDSIPQLRRDILVCILDDELKSEAVAITLASVQKSAGVDCQVVFFKKVEPNQVDSEVAWFMDQPFQLTAIDGGSISLSQVCTRGALLLLRAGDELNENFLGRCLDILTRQPQISYVSSWKLVRSSGRTWVQSHPFPAMLELAPFEAHSLLNRCVIRTPTGLKFLDIFDGRSGCFAEVDLLWRMDNNETCGVIIPEALVQIKPEIVTDLRTNSQVLYMILNDKSTHRQESLSRYLLMLSEAYPRSLLPLQTAWIQKSGLAVSEIGFSEPSFISHPGWRRRLYLKLSKGGLISQTLLKWLMWLWWLLKG